VETQAGPAEPPEAEQHIPVMYAEVLDALAPVSGKAYLDATVGLGGHAWGILERSAPGGRLFGLDADPQALVRAQARLAEFGERVLLVQGRHADLGRLARQHGFEQVQGILLDLGVSSLQLDDAERGFSFREDGPLDMRMGPERELTAAEIVNTWDEEDLAHIIYTLGEERYSRRIAKAICAQRPFHSTLPLAELIAKLLGRREKIHPATRTFQALRIAVNDELGSLESVLPQARDLLAPGGRLVVIAFHSLEDRIVKHFIQTEARDCICPPRVPACVCGHVATLKTITKKPLRPTDDEAARNPRCRSARLRVAERLTEAHPAQGQAIDAWGHHE
jgi:16S rRNA (cytosine1402-N4)-methyltransferase